MSAGVECRSDSTYPEKPVAVMWAGLRHEVDHILSRSRTPKGLSFRVQTTDGLTLVLFYDVAADTWDIHPV
jgi:hypothetical protein